MKKSILLLCILIGSLSQAVAQITANDTLNYSFSLYGQTRRFKVAYEKQDRNLVMHWTILRNMKWWVGTFTMTPASLESGENFCWTQPIDGQYLTVKPTETVWLLSQKQLKELTATPVQQQPMKDQLARLFLTNLKIMFQTVMQPVLKTVHLLLFVKSVKPKKTQLLM